MGQAINVDFDKMRRKRRRGQFIKRLVILFVILFGVLSILSFSGAMLDLLDIGVLHYINDFMREIGGEGYPIPAPGGAIRDVKGIEGNIAVLNDTTLYIYNKRGKELQGVQGVSDGTVLLTAGGSALTYEVGGTRFKIYSRSNLLLDGESEYGLISAALGLQGNYALISHHKQYTAQVTVFNSRFETEFQWFSNELVAAAALSPGGGHMAAGCIGAQSGILRSTVLLFSFDTPSEISRLEFTDELLLRLEYVDEKRVGVLTDRGYYIMDDAGKITASYGFGGERLVESRLAGGDALLLCESLESRTQTVILLNGKGMELGRIQTGKKVLDMQSGSREVYLLTDDGVAVYNRELILQRDLETSGVKRILLLSDKLYCFTPEQIYVLEG